MVSVMLTSYQQSNGHYGEFLHVKKNKNNKILLRKRNRSLKFKLNNTLKKFPHHFEFFNSIMFINVNKKQLLFKL